MKESVAELWVTALRSGEYKQTTHRLKRRDDPEEVLRQICDQ